MSIGGNLGMAFFSNDLGASAMGNLSGSTNSGSVEFTGESPFQKLITQALTSNGSNSATGTEMQAEAGTASSSEGAQEANSISSLLTGLLFGSINQSKLKLQVTENDLSDSKELSVLSQEDTETSELAGESLETMLAMYDGPFKAYLVSNNGDVNSRPSKSELSADTVAELLGSAQTAGNGSDSLANNTVSDSAKLSAQIIGSNGKMTVMADMNGKTIEFTGYAKGIEGTDAADRMTGLNDSVDEAAESAQTVQGMTVMELTALTKKKGMSESSAAIGNVKQVNPEQEVLKTDMPVTEAQSVIEISERGDRKQLNAGGSGQGLQQEITASKGNAEMVTDNMNDSVKAAAFQSQLQSTASADTSAVDQLTQPVETTEAYSQIKDEILTTLEKKGPTEFKMQLQPENLGQIDVSLKISEGKLIIDIMADRSQTQALLTGQVDKLISSMGLQNVKVESVQVSQQMNSDSQNSQNQGNHMNSGMDFSQGRQQSGETAESWQQLSSGISGIKTEFIAEETIKNIQQTRDSFSRMNYVI